MSGSETSAKGPEPSSRGFGVGGLKIKQNLSTLLGAPWRGWFCSDQCPAAVQEVGSEREEAEPCSLRAFWQKEMKQFHVTESKTTGKGGDPPGQRELKQEAWPWHEAWGCVPRGGQPSALSLATNAAKSLVGQIWHPGAATPRRDEAGTPLDGAGARDSAVPWHGPAGAGLQLRL